MHLVDYHKNTDFIQRGKSNLNEYFVLGGVVKSYLLNPEGEEVTLAYYTAGSILSPYTTRTSDTRSTLNFKALTDVQLSYVDASYFEKLMIDYLDIRTLGNTVLQQELMRKVEKEIALASLTAKERLLLFRKKYHSLENLISHSDIASYLGITNVSLSRLRKEIS